MYIELLLTWPTRCQQTRAHDKEKCIHAGSTYPVSQANKYGKLVVRNVAAEMWVLHDWWLKHWLIVYWHTWRQTSDLEFMNPL